MDQLARILSLVFLVVFTSCATIGPLPDAPTSGASAIQHLGVIVGARTFDEDEFAPVEDQTAFGVEYTGYYSPTAHAGLTVGFQHSSEDDEEFAPGFGNFDVDVSVDEIYVGVQVPILHPARSPVVPYVGAGATYLRGDLDVSLNGSSASEDDSTLGVYAHGGVRFVLAEHLVLGIDLRAVFPEDFEIAGIDIDGRYTQIAGFLGFAF